MEPNIENKQVVEIMIPLSEYPHIYVGDTLRTAIETLSKCQLESHGKKSLPRMLLVFNRDEELVGLVRRRDIMRGLEPDFLSSKPLTYRKKLFDVEIDPNLTELSYDGLIKGILARAELQIDDIMRPVQVTINHDNHIIKAIYEMVDTNISLLPVLKDDKVVGVLRSVDVFNEILPLVLGYSPETCDTTNDAD